VGKTPEFVVVVASRVREVPRFSREVDNAMRARQKTESNPDSQEIVQQVEENHEISEGGVQRFARGGCPNHGVV
jgi:hypothetical protein